jgi:hypothetical protein
VADHVDEHPPDCAHRHIKYVVRFGLVHPRRVGRSVYSSTPLKGRTMQARPPPMPAIYAGQRPNTRKPPSCRTRASRVSTNPYQELTPTLER